jgi:hypothetical protein
MPVPVHAHTHTDAHRTSPTSGPRRPQDRVHPHTHTDAERTGGRPPG